MFFGINLSWYQIICKLARVSIYFFIFLSANKLLWSMTKTQCEKFYHKRAIMDQNQGM